MKTEILTTIPKKIKKVDRNTLTAYSSGNPATANSTYMIHFSVTLIRKNYASYGRVRLRFRQSNTSTASALLYKSSSKYVNTAVCYDLTRVVEDGVTYREVDITQEYLSEATVNYYSIVCDGTLSLYLSSLEEGYSPQLIVEYIDDKESFIGQKTLDGSAGRALNYSVNVRSGRPTFVKPLLQIETVPMPISLGLYFNPLKATTALGSMPKGWNFNYTQELILNTEGYEYIDGRGCLHQFLPSLNNSDVYYDGAGTGLILEKKSDTTFEITDGYSSKLTFTNLKLAKVGRKVYQDNGTVKEYEIEINLDSNNNIESINDLSTSTTIVTFDYEPTANTIIISALGYPSIKLVKDTNSLLTYVEEENTRKSYYTYSSDGLLLTAKSDNKDMVVFTYDSFKRVNTITTCVDSETNTLNKETIEYDVLGSFVTNKFGVKKGYSFNEDGEFIGDFEVSGGKHINMRYLYKTDEYALINKGNEEAYQGFEEKIVSSSNNPQNLTKSSILSKGTLTLTANKEYTLTFIYKFDNASYIENGSKISVIQNGQTLCSQFLDQRVNFYAVGSVKFTCNGSTALTVKLEHNNNTGIMYVKDIVICEANNIERYLTVSQYLGNNQSFSDGVKTYYVYSNDSFYYGTNATKVNEKMHYEDLVENKKNIAMNPSSYHAWYNKKKGLIANTSGVMINSSIGGIQLSNLLIATVTLKDNKTYFDIMDYTSDSTIKNFLCTNYSKVKVGSNVYQISSNTLNKSFLTAKETKCSPSLYDITTTYSFDAYGNCVVELTTNASNAKNIKKMYEYNKMILKSQTTFVDGDASTITYNTNSNTGVVEKITYPDTGFDTYEYYDNTIGKLKKIYQTVDLKENSNELTYDNDKITNYKGINDGLTVEYDEFNIINKFKNATSTVWSIDRTFETDGLLENVWYGTTGSFYIKNKYDKYGKLILRQESSSGSSYSDVLKYFYSDLPVDEINTTSPSDSILNKNAKSKLRKVVDCYIPNEKDFYYDNLGKTTKETNTNTNYKPSKIEYTYDLIDRLSTKSYDSGLRVEGVEYANSVDNEVSKITSAVKVNSSTINSNVVYTKDELGRIEKELVTTTGTQTLTREFEYLDTDNRATNLIKTIKLSKGSTLVDTLNYEYDIMGRITKVYNTSDTINTTYQYDKLGRLVREDNKEIGKSIVITYDKNGNILTKKSGTYTTGTFSATSTESFAYSSTYSDELNSYKGQPVSVSATGNITSIGTTTYSWSKEILLLKVYKSSYNYSNYVYDGAGVRIQKTVYNNGTTQTHRYICDGTRILEEIITGGSYTGTLTYIYLGNQVIGFNYNGNNYFFHKNLQGDIISIYNASNTKVAAYEYDAWGNHTITLDTNSIGTINPFRYRGYYYDRESNLYYCNARYYNPEILRWMSLDSLEYIDESKINGCNLYAYCGNDPVNNFDPSGHSAILIGLIIGAIIGAAAGFGAAAYVDYTDDGEVFNGSVAWYDYLGATVLGAGVGAALGAGIGYIAPQIASAISSFSGMSFSTTLNIYGWMNKGGALVYGVAKTMTLTVTGAQILTGVTAGLTAMFSLGASRYKPKDSRPNYVQNEEFKRICDEYGLNDKQRDRIHHRISKKGYTDEEIRDLIERLYPNLKR